MKKRSRARELALQSLYQLDLRGEEFLEEARTFLRDQEPDKTAREFALSLVQGTAQNADEIDGVIRDVAQNWDIERMAVIEESMLGSRYDRTVDSHSAYEMLTERPPFVHPTA